MKDFQEYLNETQEIGFVEQSNHSLAYVNGLPNVAVQEIIIFETGEAGFVMSLLKNVAEVLVFTKYALKVGTRAVRTGNPQEMPVGFELLGQAVDPFGHPLDAMKPFKRPQLSRPIDSPPSGIHSRARIDKPLETGVTIVDMLIPLGKGQRELLIGDRKTGKTAFLYQTILNQARQGTICIFAAIGKKKMDIKRTEEFFVKSGIQKNTVLIASGSEDPAGVIYLTPYCAMALAEYYRDEGHDVLVVMDDLFTHAKFYREIALIGKRFPGRNSYPADIFYTHARLVERAGNFVTADGSAHSISCLPVVESIQGDIAGFIQTNLMSMTDGHLYFDIDIFGEGRRPAVNPFVSVSRVGRQTQTPLKLSITREIMSFLTLYERMESFSHFGAEVSPSVKRTLTMGSYILRYFMQGPTEVMDLNLQLIVFSLLWQGFWDSTDAIERDMKKIHAAYQNNDEAKKIVEEMLGSSKNINDLLAAVRSKIVILVQTLGIQLEGKIELMGPGPTAQPAKPQATPAPQSPPQTPQQPQQPAAPGAAPAAPAQPTTAPQQPTQPQSPSSPQSPQPAQGAGQAQPQMSQQQQQALQSKELPAPPPK